MEKLDLDIKNYNLTDLLNLFKVNHNFTKKDLKKCREMALMTHPDKSNLDKDVFLFFLKAYKRLEEIYKFRVKKQQNIYNVEYTNDMVTTVNESDKLLLKRLHGKSVREFNSWFNEMFEKTKISDKEMDEGYGEWFSKEMEKIDEVKSLSDFDIYFDKKKEKQKALIKYNGIEDMESTTSGYNLNRELEGRNKYKSHIFSKLQYEDLKVAHSETLIPVTYRDFEKKEKYRNLNELNTIRKNQDVSPISLNDSNKILEDRQLKQDELASITAYNLMKQQEEVDKCNEEWWKYLKQLKN